MISKSQQQPNVDVNTLNLLPVPVILCDQKKLYFLNKKAIALLEIPGAKLKDPGKRALSDYIDPGDQATLKTYLNAVAKGKGAESLKLKTKGLKKKTGALELQANTAWFDGKKIFQIILSKSEDLLPPDDENPAQLLEKISTNSVDVIFDMRFQPKVHIKFISQSSKKLLGYAPEEFYKDPLILTAQIHEEDRKYIISGAEDYLKLSNGNQQRKAKVRFFTKKGLLRYLEIVVNPVFDAKKKLTGIIGNMRDVTENVKTEALLMETKEKFDQITNNGNDIMAFYTFLPTDKYLYVSPNIKKVLGFTPKQLLDDNMFFNRRVIGPNEYLLNTDKQLKRIQKHNLPENCFYVFRILNKNKEEIWLESNFFPIINPEGKVSFFLNILRDITQQREKEIEVQNQYNNYRNLLDNSPVAYIIHHHGVCLYCNNALLKLLKLKNKKQIQGKFIIDFFAESDRKRAIERVDEIYKGKNLNKFHSYHVHDVDGTPVEVDVKSILIKFNDVDCVLALVNNLSDQRQREGERMKSEIIEINNKLLQKEIKERKDVEKSLLEKTAHLSSIFESSSHLLWTVNKKYEVTTYNQNFHNVVRLQHGISIKPGYKVDEFLQKNKTEYVDYWYPKYAEAFAGKKLEFEKEDINHVRKVYRKVYLNPIFDENNEVTDINCIAHDVTDSKIYEQKLLNQTGKLSAIFESSHHYIWTISEDGKLTSFNKNYYDLITSLYNTEPYLGLVLDRGVLSNDKEYTELLNYHYKKAFSGAATNFEIETLDKSYKKIYLEIFLNPISDGDRVVEVSGIAHNITDKRYVQQRMEQSLKEKEILLKEVHHRVKNNMQVVSSILNLQSSYVSDEYALTLLKESQNRIKTMAYIHESLYQNKSFTSINFSEYVHTLVNNIVQSYSYSKDKIRLELNVAKINLSLDSSIPVGLIINELVTNAIKHGFPGSREGLISINLKCENNFVFLELKDNGVGFGPDIDFENSHSLGLQLVNTLIEQIEGKFIFKSEKDLGTEILITFKM